MSGSTRRLNGRIKVHPAGYGFVVPDDNSEDVPVSARHPGTALDADPVDVAAGAWGRGWRGGRGRGG